jgi:hypothetical protein
MRPPRCQCKRPTLDGTTASSQPLDLDAALRNLAVRTRTDLEAARRAIAPNPGAASSIRLTRPQSARKMNDGLRSTGRCRDLPRRRAGGPCPGLAGPLGRADAPAQVGRAALTTGDMRPGMAVSRAGGTRTVGRAAPANAATAKSHVPILPWRDTTTPYGRPWTRTDLEAARRAIAPNRGSGQFHQADAAAISSEDERGPPINGPLP